MIVGKYYYVAFVNIKKSMLGVISKICTQVLSFNKISEVKMLAFIVGNPEKEYRYEGQTDIAIVDINNKIHINKSIVRFWQIIWFFKEFIAKEECLIYLRYPLADPFLYYVLSVIKKIKKHKYVTEHQSKEIEELAHAKRRILVLFEKIMGSKMLSIVDGIVAVTEEIRVYELERAGKKIKSITVGNGIDVESVPLRKYQWDQKDVKLIFVGSVARWHGLDRVISGLARYDGEIGVSLYIVGDGPEMSCIKNMASGIKDNKRIHIMGYKRGRELNSLFDICDVAVGSLGIHRKGLKETSELKAREYCARGIPFICSATDVDFPKSFKYRYVVPEGESNIEINNIVRFAMTVVRDPNHSLAMRSYASKNLDWKVKMEKTKRFMEEINLES